MVEFVMPSLGADMISGKLMQWLVSPGDQVNHGDIVAVVETQKGAIDVEIFQDGVIGQLLVAEGTEVPVGAPLAIIGGVARAQVGAPESVALSAPTGEEIAVSAVQQAPTPVTQLTVPVGGNGRVHASPLARRLAAELGIDLAQVHGTRPGGAICAGDVERAAASPPAQPMAQPAAPVAITSPVGRPPSAPATPVDRQRSMREAIAAAMSRANRDIPHYYLETEIDMKRTLDWLAETNAKREVADRLIYAAPLIKAVALATNKVPEVNGFYTANGFEGSDAVHVGVAISLRQGGWSRLRSMMPIHSASMR